jgi:hypothetical protein
MRTRHWTRESGGTPKRGEAAGREFPGPYAGVAPGVTVGGGIAGRRDRCSRGRGRIPCSILGDEKLRKGERRKQRTRASVRVGARSACGGAAGGVTYERDAQGSSQLCRCGWKPTRIR